MENENEYLLELNFNDQFAPPWVEKQYPDNIEDAKKVINNLKETDSSFQYAELYETKLVDLE